MGNTLAGWHGQTCSTVLETVWELGEAGEMFRRLIHESDRSDRELGELLAMIDEKHPPTDERLAGAPLLQ